MLKAYFLICLSSSFFILSVAAQQLSSIHYTTENGLPSSETYDIIQDKSGYIWIATDRGVSRFNGYEFENFTTHEGLAENTVLNLYEDEKGRVWFLSISGFLCYYEKGKIHKYKWNDKITIGKKSFLRSFYANAEDELVIGSFGKGIFKIDSKGEIRKMFDPFKKSHSFLATLENGILHYGFYLCDSVTLKKTLFRLKTDNGIHDFFFETKPSTNNIIGITRKNGSFIVRMPGRYYESIRGDTIFTEDTEMIRFAEDNDSSLWVSLRNGGVRRYAPNEPLASINYEVFYPKEIITSVYQDRDGGYWFATLINGIYYVPSLNYRFFQVPSNYSISAFCDGGKNGILVGYTNGIVESYSETEKMNRFNLNPDGDSVNMILSLIHFDNTVIISSIHRVVELHNTVIRDFKNPRYIRNMHSADEVIYGTSNYTLSRLNPVDLSISRGKRWDVKMDVIFVDGHDKIWIGDFTGVYSIKEDTVVPEFKDNTILKNRISGIAETNNGFMCFTTIGEGLILERKGSFTYINDRKGILSNIINDIFVDGNVIWLATNKGISRVSISENGRYEIRNFTKENGLPESEIYHIFKRENLIWAASKKRVMFFDPKCIELNTSGPEIKISRVTSNGISIDMNNLEFYEGDFPVRVGFFGISFRNSGKMMYKYRIRGYSNSWNYSNNRTIEIFNLPPGNYMLEISGLNEDGYWSAKAAVLPFSVIPPFYKTWWFLSCMIILFLSGLTVLFLIRIKKIKRKKDIEVALMSFKQRALAGQINPHFIHNSLNSIQSFIMTDDKRSASKYLSRFSAMMRKSMEHLRKEMVTLDEEIALLETYISLEQLRFNNKFISEIIVDNRIDRMRCKIPAMLVQPFVENAILHGINESDRMDLKVIIRFTMTNGFLFCEIIDNGIGINRSMRLRNLNKSSRKSEGLSITSERLQIICDSMNQKFYYHIEDRSALNAAETGTQVFFYLPFKIVSNDEGNSD